MVSFFRVSGEAFTRVVLDSSKSARKECFLGEPFCGKQSCPTLPRHPAVRPDATRPWYFRVLEWTCWIRQMVSFWVTQTCLHAVLCVLAKPCCPALRRFALTWLWYVEIEQWWHYLMSAQDWIIPCRFGIQLSELVLS